MNRVTRSRDSRSKSSLSPMNRTPSRPQSKQRSTVDTRHSKAAVAECPIATNMTSLASLAYNKMEDGLELRTRESFRGHHQMAGEPSLGHIDSLFGGRQLRVGAQDSGFTPYTRLQRKMSSIMPLPNAATPNDVTPTSRLGKRLSSVYNNFNQNVSLYFPAMQQQQQGNQMALARLTSASAGLKPLLETSELTSSHKGSPVVQINVGSSLDLKPPTSLQLPFAAAKAPAISKQERRLSCEGGINKRRVDKTIRKSTTLTNTKITGKAPASLLEDSQSYLSKNSLENQQKRATAGRKLADPERYCFESQKKIDELQARLDHDKTLSAKEKQKLRNQISAQKSRQNKKAQSHEYQLKIEHFKQQFTKVIDVLSKELDEETKKQVMCKLLEMTPDATAFVDLPDLAATNSAPTGAKIVGIKRQGSKRGAEPSKRAKLAQKTQELSTVLESFVGLTE